MRSTTVATKQPLPSALLFLGMFQCFRWCLSAQRLWILNARMPLFTFAAVLKYAFWIVGRYLSSCCPSLFVSSIPPRSPYICFFFCWLASSCLPKENPCIHNWRARLPTLHEARRLICFHGLVFLTGKPRKRLPWHPPFSHWEDPLRRIHANLSSRTPPTLATARVLHPLAPAARLQQGDTWSRAGVTKQKTHSLTTRPPKECSQSF